jgi:hypothetical protein
MSKRMSRIPPPRGESRALATRLTRRHQTYAATRQPGQSRPPPLPAGRGPRPSPTSQGLANSRGTGDGSQPGRRAAAASMRRVDSPARPGTGCARSCCRVVVQQRRNLKGTRAFSLLACTRKKGDVLVLVLMLVLELGEMCWSGWQGREGPLSLCPPPNPGPHNSPNERHASRPRTSHGLLTGPTGTRGRGGIHAKAVPGKHTAAAAVHGPPARGERAGSKG